MKSHQITIGLFEAMTFGGTFRKNVARLNALRIKKDYIMPGSSKIRYISQRISPK